MFTWSTVHPCGLKKKKAWKKVSKHTLGRLHLESAVPQLSHPKKLTDACKKKVFSPPSPIGRPISLAAEPAPRHMAHQPRLTIAFFILQITPKCFPLCHPATRRAQCHA